MFSDIRDALEPARDEARTIMESKGEKPQIFHFSTYRAFFASISTALRLTLKSPKILFFGLLQWFAIILGYLIWTQVLNWIPDDVWAAIKDQIDKDKGSGAFVFCNLALLAWSFLVICVVSYPVGLCTAAMVAVNDLRASGEPVSFARCLSVADRHLGRIWAFTVLDSWITVSAILDRLPKKHYHRTAADELLYYAWKVATIAAVPALVNGRPFLAAGRDSLVILRNAPARAIGLRLGYSAVCWVIGIAAYAAGFFIPWDALGIRSRPHEIFRVYFVMALPICFAVATITLLVRPVYVLAAAALYSERIDVIEEVERDVAYVRPWEQQLLSARSLVFLMLLAVLLFAYLFGDRIGLSNWFAHLGHLDVARYLGQH
jgi:hypothetical protein